MRILFYSTNANIFEGKDWNYSTYPSCAEQLETLCHNHPENEYIVMTQLPGLFLVDTEENRISERAASVRYALFESDDAETIAGEIAAQKPQLAVAFSFWLAPFDWLSVKDSVIGEKLTARGIKALYNSVETALISFDKSRTQEFLRAHGFNVKNSVYVNHELFFKTKKEIKENVYQLAIFHQLEKLHYPVVVKDTTGLSSFAMDVCSSAEDVKKLLLSKKNSSDRLVEEYIEGFHFGSEIYGTPGAYRVMPPFILSLNKYGITSPKQSIKIGPVTASRFRTDILTKELTRLAEVMQFSGIAQTDLVFDGEKWFIVDINPRLSGISGTYAVSTGRTIFELILELSQPECGFAMNFKFPILTAQQLCKLKALSFVKAVRTFENRAAKQDREVGYCEVIIGNAHSFLDLERHLDYLHDHFFSIVEPLFYERAKALFKILKENDEGKTNIE